MHRNNIEQVPRPHKNKTPVNAKFLIMRISLFFFFFKAHLNTPPRFSCDLFIVDSLLIIQSIQHKYLLTFSYFYGCHDDKNIKYSQRIPKKNYRAIDFTDYLVRSQ